MINRNIKPRYEVKPLAGMRTVTKTRRNNATGMNETYDAEEPAGYMVFFPAGHSIRVSAEELHRLGYDRPADLIDMDDGEVVGQMELSLEQLVRRRAGASRQRADAGAVSANQGD